MLQDIFNFIRSDCNYFSSGSGNVLVVTVWELKSLKEGNYPLESDKTFYDTDQAALKSQIKTCNPSKKLTSA